MTNKKELNLEELEKIAGGVLSKEANSWIVKNLDVIFEMYNKDPGTYESLRFWIDKISKEEREYSLEEIKTLVSMLGYDMSKFKD